MIISHDHRYVMLQVPQTASTAVGLELLERYGGERVLDKHSHLHELRRALGRRIDGYLVVAGIRNPLDQIVSQYFKIKSNHKGQFTDPARRADQGGWITPQRLVRYELVSDGADFATYFRTFYRRPFTSGWRAEQKRADVLVRFEHLDEDFGRLLERLGLERQRPLPERNRTEARERSFDAYYPPALRPLAASVCGPYMADWGYQLPADWDVPAAPSPARWTAYLAIERAKAARSWVNARR